MKGSISRGQNQKSRSLVFPSISSQLISWLALDWCSQTEDVVRFFDVRSVSSPEPVAVYPM